MPQNVITLTRDVTAVQIPHGNSIHLPAGTGVLITQDLGGTFTVVIPNQAGLYRISGDDADALGKEKVASAVSQGDPTSPITEDKIWEVLKTCYDPEIPVNIVDLGLIYSLTIDHDGQGARVNVKMTLTAPGCGMGPVIAGDAQKKISELAGVNSAQVEVVWDPPWSPSLITPEGRKKLGMD
jgi:probable FeS assembly SUF system protein SufT